MSVYPNTFIRMSVYPLSSYVCALRLGFIFSATVSELRAASMRLRLRLEALRARLVRFVFSEAQLRCHPFGLRLAPDAAWPLHNDLKSLNLEER